MQTGTPSFEQWRDLARNGEPDAQFQRAQALVAQQDAGPAFELFRAAAAQGHADAMVQLARMLLYGVVAPADIRAAVHWLEAAERAGNAAAMGLLANIALGGVVMARDFERIGHRLLAAAKGEDVSSMRALAMYFGRERDNPDAMRQSQTLLEQAARLGDAVSMCLLLERVRHGEAAATAETPQWQAMRERIAMPPLPSVAAPPAPAPQRRPLRLDLEASVQAPRPVPRSARPQVVSIDGLLSAEECRYVMIMGGSWLKRAQVANPQTGERLEHPVRTAFDTTFQALQEDFQLRLLQLRMAGALGIDFTCSEQMVLLRYLPGQEYRPHRDYLPPQALAGDNPQAGQRAATLCCYLNQVDAGGGTAFPEGDLVVEPRIGRAVAFRNLDDAGQPAPESLHAGLPVLQGEKWLVTLWLRQRRYRAF